MRRLSVCRWQNASFSDKDNNLIAVKSKASNTTTSVEFVIVMSMMMSLTALSIDAILPALGLIAHDLSIINPNDRQLIISVIFLGQAVGQLFFGSLSDKTGRKRAAYAGYTVFIIGSVMSAAAADYSLMLFGRILQGIGISAPRALSMAMIRDNFEGRRMAQTMSLVMAVFILVPAIAPTIGQGILSFTDWRGIFGAFVIFALITVVWLGVRIPETLVPERRKPFSLHRILNSIVEMLKIRPALGYTITAGLIYGVFTGYLNSSQQIFQEQYALGASFPLFFGAIALSMGLASLLNSRLVMRFGMTKLVQWTLGAIFALAMVFLVIAISLNGQPPLWVLMVFFMLAFFCVGILFGNVNSLAMEPLGHMAGLGAAVVGSLTTLISMVLGTMIGSSYNGTILPLVIGMVLLMGFANLVARWAAAKQPVQVR